MKKDEDLSFHDVANLFPLMTGEEFEALKEDIRINGLNESIWIYNGKIIDGRNRYRACKAIDVIPKYKEYSGKEENLIDFVISLNLHRRHLTTSQKACMAVDLLPALEKRAKEELSKKMREIKKGKDVAKLPQGERSRTKAARYFGVSERYVGDAKKLKTESEELFNRVKKGELTLQKAKKSLILKEEKKQDVAKLPQGEKNYDIGKIELTRGEKVFYNELIDNKMPKENAENLLKVRIEKRMRRKSKPKTQKNVHYQKKYIGLPQELIEEVQKRAKKNKTNFSEEARKLILEGTKKKL